MRMRNCPKCHGTGRDGPAGRINPRCGFCHGNKRVSSDFVKWSDQRADQVVKQSARIDIDLEYRREQMLKDKMTMWDKDNPRPRKYEKA